MRTVNNSNINYTVENLVAKYRNYVDEHCPKEYSPDEWEDENGKWHINDSYIPFSPEGNADEQLIVTLYKKVAGDDVDEQIVEALSKYAEKFYEEALTEDEMSFLCEQFSETVAYEFAHRHEWFFGDSGMRISEERIRLVKEYVKPKKGDRIFIADTEYGDLAVLFPECIIAGFTGWSYKQKETWALGQIRLFAANIRSEIVSGEKVNGEYSYTLPAKGSVDVVIFRVNENKYFAQRIFGTECTDIEALYELLKPNGKMLFFSELITEMAGKKSQNDKNTLIYDFRVRIAKEKAISSIIAYEDNGLLGYGQSKYIMLALCKGENGKVCIKDETKSIVKYIDSDELDAEILWPSYYMATRPTDGISLSAIIRLPEEEELAEFVKGEGYILPKDANDMLLVLPSSLGDSYKDANLWQKTVNNVCDPAFKEKEWVMFHVANEPCVLLTGSTAGLRVGYTIKVPDRGFAYLADCYIVPKEGIDVRYIAALLFDSSVKAQILTICDGNLNNHVLSLVFDKIIVPNHNEKGRLAFLVDTSDQAISNLRKEREKDIEEKLSSMKADYINEVRMRKHDMRPHLRQLASCERLMRYYIENVSDFDELKKNLSNQLEYSHVALENISAIIDHLSEEEKFGTPQIVNIDEFLTGIEINHDENEGFEIEYNCNQKAFRDAGFAIPDYIKQFQAAHELGINKFNFIQEQLKDDLPFPLFINIAPVDFQRLVTNIIENARKHGFTDKARKDYYIGIDLTIDTKRKMYQIDFCNNGNPLPEGMDKEHFGIRGVKAGVTGDNGNGGYIIKSIVTHYGGDYDVFTENGLTTIRIFLPTTKI